MILNWRKCIEIFEIVFIVISLLCVISKSTLQENLDVGYKLSLGFQDNLSAEEADEYSNNNKKDVPNLNETIIINADTDETSTRGEDEGTEDSPPPFEETTAITDANTGTTTTEVFSSSTSKENKEPWIKTGGGIATVTVIALVSVLAVGGGGFYWWGKRKKNIDSDKESYTQEILAVRSKPRKMV